jgi:thiol-disulfide isomerase/thioredoxin
MAMADAGEPGPDIARSACVYPAGPFGTALGKVVSPNLTWDGYIDGSQTVGTLKMSDLHDCDGSKGLNAILVVQAAQWCGVCKSEASHLEANMTGGWMQSGIRAIELIIETSSGAPATTTTAKQWRDAYKLNHVAVLADPKFTFAHSGTNGLPVRTIIDPRTMQIVEKLEGGGPIDAELDALVTKNRK